MPWIFDFQGKILARSKVKKASRSELTCIQNSAQRRYSVVLIPDADDGGYVVEVPALPGLVTYGKSVEEALEMARDAIEGWIDVQVETGRPIPIEDEPVQVVTLAV